MSFAATPAVYSPSPAPAPDAVGFHTHQEAMDRFTVRYILLAHPLLLINKPIGAYSRPGSYHESTPRSVPCCIAIKP
jgi:hypothetical protein